MTDSPEIPYLLRAAKGEILPRPPVWMMRQAGRYMQIYRELRDKYPSFRERSENADLAIEISLQPWRAFQPDGVIMFSDILTPLAGIGIPFDIIESKGPIIDSPIRTQAQVDQLNPLDPDQSLPFIKTILKTLRQEVGNKSTVLGFVGAPWTLAAYAVEGKGSKSYSVIKGMAFSEPSVLHQFLDKLADMIATYVRYQIDCGAQVVQMFDSWAGQLTPQDYDVFAVDIISVDWTVDMAEARQRLGKSMMVQGNIDPGVLFGSQPFIRERIIDTIRKAGNQGHILNLGHGVLVGTPEDNVRFFFETAKQADQLLAVHA